MRIQDMTVYIILMLFSLVMVFAVIPAWSPESSGYGLASSTVPTLMCWVVFVISLVQAVMLLRKGFAGQGAKPVTRDVIWHLFRYFGVMLLIFPAWHFLGFIAGGMVVLGLLYWITGVTNLRAVVAVCVLLPAVCYLVLWYGLHIPTP